MAHLIAVSTAYVASTHQGEAKEELLSENRFTLDVAWEGEVTCRPTPAGTTSRTRHAGPTTLRGFTKKARAEIGAAGDHLSQHERRSCARSGSATSSSRRARPAALSLGWPDAYPFTKALGEQALVDQWEGKVPITFVRPSIIESALAEPRPGWIRGFRMAEPIIVSYARGLLAEFPGVPEGIIDVIPVDLVVAAILAVGGAGSRRGPAEGVPRRLGRAEPAALRATGRARDRTSSSATRSTTTAASRSACPSGRFPGAGGCSASSAAPTPS